MIVVTTPSKLNVKVTGPGVSRTVAVGGASVRIVTNPGTVDAIRFAAIQAMFNRIYLGGF